MDIQLTQGSVVVVVVGGDSLRKAHQVYQALLVEGHWACWLSYDEICMALVEVEAVMNS